MKFTIGNVVKLPGERSLVIITDVGRKVNNIELVDWVSFEYSNSSGCTRMISYEEKKDCDCSIVNL